MAKYNKESIACLYFVELNLIVFENNYTFAELQLQTYKCVLCTYIYLNIRTCAIYLKLIIILNIIINQRYILL